MSIEQAKWLVEFYQQVADGGEMQVLYKAHWSLAASGPDLDSLQEHWRVVMPPKVMPVDMSVLVNSGIDCEFATKSNPAQVRSSLLDINGQDFIAANGCWYSICQPRINYWFSVMNFTNVEQLLSDLDKAGFVVKCDDWQAKAFQITGIAKGRCWPWEQSK